MNRSILIMGIMGVVACLGLTMLMGKFLSMAPRKSPEGLAARKFIDLFEAQTRGRPRLEFERQEEEGREPWLRVTAWVTPRVTVDVGRMLFQMGTYLWRSEFKSGKTGEVRIHWKDPVSGKIARVEIPEPRGFGRNRASERRRKESSRGAYGPKPLR